MLSSVLDWAEIRPPASKQLSSAPSMQCASSRSLTRYCGLEPEGPPSGARASWRTTEPLGCLNLMGTLSPSCMACLRSNRCRHALGRYGVRLLKPCLGTGCTSQSKMRSFPSRLLLASDLAIYFTATIIVFAPRTYHCHRQLSDSRSKG